jgi:6-phosphogluconolactonase
MNETDTIHVFAADRFAEDAAAFLAGLIADASSARGECRLALAGGSSPRPVYQELAKRHDVPWDRVQFLFGDERAVPAGDSASNYRMTAAALLEQGLADESRVFRIRAELPAEDARADYEEVVARAPIDVLLLGMGTDGHTASLFPGSDGAETTTRVVVTESPIPPSTRISLSYRAIAEARVVVFLVTGANKAARLAQVHRERATHSPHLPAARVHSDAGRVIWLVDTDAAAELPPSPSAGDIQ